MTDATMWSIFAMLMSLAGLAASVVMAVCAVFLAGRRARWLKRAGLAFVASVVLVITGTWLAVFGQDDAARIAGGFDTVGEMRAARSAGVDTKAAYDAMLAEQARGAADEARRAAEEAAAEKAAEEARCREDMLCWGREHHFRASVACAPRVEDLARIDFKWTNGWTDQKFSHFRWKNQETGTLTYLGDTIQFQNGFGAWVRHVYACDYDPESGVVLSVGAEPGRL